MSAAFPGWTNLPFLQIKTHPITEPAARRDRLSALVDRLVSEKAIPRGHELAARAVREVGGLIRATLLKPEDPLRPDRHDIAEFGTFSGGEKMTAAILLYVTLAQLRARGRQEHGREREAGVLVLDNPLGTASKREFVELQLRVARQMGVQLIYTTGVNDLGALDVLPRILRLRKRHRDRRSGDLLLSQEAPEEHVEGVQANLRSWHRRLKSFSLACARECLDASASKWRLTAKSSRRFYPRSLAQIFARGSPRSARKSKPPGAPGFRAVTHCTIMPGAVPCPSGWN